MRGQHYFRCQNTGNKQVEAHHRSKPEQVTGTSLTPQAGQTKVSHLSERPSRSIRRPRGPWQTSSHTQALAEMEFQRCAVRTRHACISAAEARGPISMPPYPAGTLYDCMSLHHHCLPDDNSFSLAMGSKKSGQLSIHAGVNLFKHLSFASQEAPQTL